MTKKIICMLLCLVTVFSLTACGMLGGKDNKEDPTEPAVNTQPSDNDSDKGNVSDKETEPAKDNEDEMNEYREGSVEAMAQSFIKNLIIKDYEKALRCFAVPAETPYFTAADVEWYLPRSNYADVLDVNYENYVIIVERLTGNAEYADCKVIVKDKDSDKSKEFVLALTLDKTNKWGVQDDAFYVDEYWIVVPGGKAVLTVDGVDATADADSKHGDAKYRMLYKLKYIGKSEKKFAISSDNFETYEEAIYPVKNTKEDAAEILVKYADEAGLKYLQTVWGEIYQAILDKKSYSDMIDKLSPTADPAVMETIMTSFELMLDEGDNTDCKIIDMSFCTDDEWRTHWLSDNKLQICFNYTATWTETDWSSPKACSMKNYDWIILHVENGTYKIDTISNNEFFSELSAYTNNEYK